MASSSVTSALVMVPCGQYPPLPISIHGSLPQPMREQLSYNKTPKFAYPYTHWTVKSMSSFLQKVNEDRLLILDVISSQVPVDPWSFYSATQQPPVMVTTTFTILHHSSAVFNTRSLPPDDPHWSRTLAVQETIQDKRTPEDIQFDYRFPSIILPLQIMKTE